MNAGREMDALVAEKVMGYTLAFSEKAWTDEDWSCSDVPTERNVMAIVATHEQFPGTGAFRVSIPRYSDMLNDAWTAADHFADRYGCAIRVERVSSVWECHTKQRYVATVQGGSIAYQRSDLAFSVAAESPAHALCLAMLQAHVLSEIEFNKA